MIGAAFFYSIGLAVEGRGCMALGGAFECLALRSIGAFLAQGEAEIRFEGLLFLFGRGCGLVRYRSRWLPKQCKPIAET
jgi:hypothetical protein